MYGYISFSFPLHTDCRFPPSCYSTKSSRSALEARMRSEWMTLCQFSFPFHSLGPDFTKCTYVQVRGDAPPIPSSASDLFVITQEPPNLSDSDSSHLPYLSKCLGEFNQIKLKELVDLLWRYHLASNPLHLPNNKNKVWTLSWGPHPKCRIQMTDKKLDCSLRYAFMLHQVPGSSAPWVAVTFTYVTQARRQIAVEKWVRNYMPRLHQKTNWEGVRKPIALSRLKGILWKNSSSLLLYRDSIFSHYLKWPAEPIPWKWAAGLRKNLISFNKMLKFSE